MNQFEVKETRIEFLINNSRVQSNNSKINIKLKVEVADMIFCQTNDIASSFSLVLSEANLEPSLTSKMERFVTIVNYC